MTPGETLTISVGNNAASCGFGGLSDACGYGGGSSSVSRMDIFLNQVEFVAIAGGGGSACGKHGGVGKSVPTSGCGPYLPYGGTNSSGAGGGGWKGGVAGAGGSSCAPLLSNKTVTSAEAAFGGVTAPNENSAGYIAPAGRPGASGLVLINWSSTGVSTIQLPTKTPTQTSSSTMTPTILTPTVTSTAAPTTSPCMGFCPDGQSNLTAAVSCVSVNACGQPDGIYWISPAGIPYRASCSGGWALAMVVNGASSTFTYSSAYWTNSVLLNSDYPDGSGSTEVKLQSFVDTPGSSIRITMTTPNGNTGAPLVLQVPVFTSLRSLFSGSFTATTNALTTWYALVPGGASLENNCNMQGINVAQSSQPGYRIGLHTNNENDCGSNDASLGIGSTYGMCGVTGSGTAGQAVCCCNAFSGTQYTGSIYGVFRIWVLGSAYIVPSCSSTPSLTPTSSLTVGALSSVTPSVTASVTPMPTPTSTSQTGNLALLYLRGVELGVNASTCNGTSIATWPNGAPSTASNPSPSSYYASPMWDSAFPKRKWNATTKQCVARFYSSCSRFAVSNVNVQNQASTIIIVARIVAGAGLVSARVLGDTQGNWLMGWYSSAHDVWLDNYNGGWISPSSPSSSLPGVWEQYTLTRDASGKSIMYKAGVVMYMSNSRPGPNQLTLGGDGAGQCSDVEVSSLLVYNYALTATEVQNMATFLLAQTSTSPSMSSTSSITASATPSSTVSPTPSLNENTDPSVTQTAASTPSGTYTSAVTVSNTVTPSTAPANNAMLYLRSEELGASAATCTGQGISRWNSAAPVSSYNPTPSNYYASAIWDGTNYPTQYWDAMSNRCVARFHSYCSRFAVSSNLNLQSNPSTVVIMARIMGTSARVFGDTAGRWFVGWQGGQHDVWYDNYNGNWLTSSSPGASLPGVWEQYTLTRDAAGNSILYKAGVVIYTSYNRPGAGQLTLGGDGAGECSDVDVHSLLVYNYALSSSDVASLSSYLIAQTSNSPTPSSSPSIPASLSAAATAVPTQSVVSGADPSVTQTNIPSLLRSVSATVTPIYSRSPSPTPGSNALLFLRTDELGNSSSMCSGQSISGWPNAAVASSYNNNPSSYNVIPWDAGKFPTRYFDAASKRCVARFSSSCTRLKVSENLKFQNSPSTVIITARIVGTGRRVLGDTSGNWFLGWHGGHHDVWYDNYNGGWITSSNPGNFIGDWETYALTRDAAGNSIMYKAGVIMYTSFSRPGANIYSLGGDGSNECSDVDISTFVVYNYALSSNELIAVCDSLRSIFSGTPMATSISGTSSVTASSSASASSSVSSGSSLSLTRSASLSATFSQAQSVSPVATSTPSNTPGTNSLLYLRPFELGVSASECAGTSINSWPNGAPISSYNSKPSSFSASPIWDGNRPTRVWDTKSSQCVARFKSTCSRFAVNGISVQNQPSTIVVMARIVGTSARVLGDTGGNWLLGWYNGQHDVWMDNYNHGWLSSSSPETAVSNVFECYILTRDSTGKSVVYKNGALLYTATVNPGPGQITLGGDGAGQCSDVDIGSFLVYNYAFSSSEASGLAKSLAQQFANSTLPNLSTATTDTSNDINMPVNNALMYLRSNELGTTSATCAGLGISSWPNAYSTQSSYYASSIWDSNYPKQYWDSSSNRCFARFHSYCTRLGVNGVYRQSQPSTVIIMARIFGESNNRVLGDTAANWLLGWNNGQHDAWLDNYGGGWLSSSSLSTTPANTFEVYALTRDQSGSSTMFKGGTQLHKSSGHPGFNQLTIGGDGSGQCSDVDVAAILVYDYALSSVQINKMVAFLASQVYGTPSPSSSQSYIASASATNTASSSASRDTGATISVTQSSFPSPSATPSISFSPAVSGTPTSAPGTNALLYLRTTELGNSAACSGLSVSSWPNVATVSSYNSNPSRYNVFSYDSAFPKRYFDVTSKRCVARFSSSCTRMRASSSLNFQYSSFTIMLTARIVGVSARVVSQVNNDWFMGWWNGQHDIWYDAGWVSNAYPGASVSGQWEQYTITRDNVGTSRFYKSGLLLQTSLGRNGFNELLLGGMGGGECSDVDIANVVIYNYQLSETEVQSMSDFLLSGFSTTPSATSSVSASSTAVSTATLSPGSSPSSSSSRSPDSTATSSVSPSQGLGSGALIYLRTAEIGNELACSGSAINVWPNVAPVSSTNPTPSNFYMTAWDGNRPRQYWDAAGGQCVARFSSSCSRFYTNGVSIRNSPFTIVFVARAVPDGTMRRSLGDMNANWLLGFYYGNVDTWYSDTYGWLFNPNSPVSKGEWVMYTLTRSETGVSKFYKLDQLMFTTSNGVGPQQLVLGGSNGGGSECSDIDFSSLLIYPYELSSAAITGLVPNLLPRTPTIISRTAHCNSGKTSATTLVSCMDVFSCKLVDGVYWIAPAAVPYKVSCLQGWTLALKIDGGLQTFAYSSAYWTNSALLNEVYPDGAGVREAKLQPFIDTPGTALRITMTTPNGNTGSPLVLQTGPFDSLQTLFSGPTLQTTSNLASWYAMVPGGATLTLYCNTQGINVPLTQQPPYRIGLVTNNANDCLSNDASLGIGRDPGYQCNLPSSGSAGQTSCAAQFSGSQYGGSVEGVFYVWVQGLDVSLPSPTLRPSPVPQSYCVMCATNSSSSLCCDCCDSSGGWHPERCNSWVYAECGIPASTASLTATPTPSNTPSSSSTASNSASQTSSPTSTPSNTASVSSSSTQTSTPSPSITPLPLPKTDSTITFSSGCDTVFVVPSNVHVVLIRAWGAGGGSYGANIGGAGAFVEGAAWVTPNETLIVRVGSGNSSGCGGAGAGVGYFKWVSSTSSYVATSVCPSGGGASSVLRWSVFYETADPLVVAGGGGGSCLSSGGGPGLSIPVTGCSAYSPLGGSGTPFQGVNISIGGGGGGGWAAGIYAGKGTAGTGGDSCAPDLVSITVKSVPGVFGQTTASSFTTPSYVSPFGAPSQNGLVTISWSSGGDTSLGFSSTPLPTSSILASPSATGSPFTPTTSVTTTATQTSSFSTTATASITPTSSVTSLPIRDYCLNSMVGFGPSGNTGDGSFAQLATIKSPSAVAVDAAGDVFFVDSGNYAIRAVSAATSAIRTVISGSPQGVAVDGVGNVYYSIGCAVKMMNATTGDIVTVAGSPPTTRFPVGTPVLYNSNYDYYQNNWNNYCNSGYGWTNGGGCAVSFGVVFRHASSILHQAHFSSPTFTPFRMQTGKFLHISMLTLLLISLHHLSAGIKYNLGVHSNFSQVTIQGVETVGLVWIQTLWYQPPQMEELLSMHRSPPQPDSQSTPHLTCT